MVPSPIPDELVELIARRFRLLAEPTRIRLFDRLRDGEATVHQLADELETSQQNVSKHLTLWPRRACSPGARKATASITGSPTRRSLGSASRSCGSVERHLLELAALVQCPSRDTTGKELSMSKNMNILDRRVRALLGRAGRDRGRDPDRPRLGRLRSCCTRSPRSCSRPAPSATARCIRCSTWSSRGRQSLTPAEARTRKERCPKWM